MYILLVFSSIGDMSSPQWKHPLHDIGVVAIGVRPFTIDLTQVLLHGIHGGILLAKSITEIVPLFIIQPRNVLPRQTRVQVSTAEPCIQHHLHQRPWRGFGETLPERFIQFETICLYIGSIPQLIFEVADTRQLRRVVILVLVHEFSECCHIRIHDDDVGSFFLVCSGTLLVC